MELILASSSPRRKQLLLDYGYDFTVVSSNYSENEFSGSPRQTAELFAFEKAKDVFNRTNGERLVLGADTIVVLDDKILGKPLDKIDAFKMLKELSGKTHSVITGYSLISETRTVTGSDQTKVTFNELSDELIHEYIETGLPLDKAGSYGIQDGFSLVKSFDGSFETVMGLPIELVDRLIKEFLKK
jgi:septum formation protein